LVTKKEAPALAHPLALKVLELEGCRNGRLEIVQRANYRLRLRLVTGSLIVIIISVIITCLMETPINNANGDRLAFLTHSTRLTTYSLANVLQTPESCCSLLNTET
jgi:hypothetical protein